jgi:hypothetical protein
VELGEAGAATITTGALRSAAHIDETRYIRFPCFSAPLRRQGIIVSAPVRRFHLTCSVGLRLTLVESGQTRGTGGASRDVLAADIGDQRAVRRRVLSVVEVAALGLRRCGGDLAGVGG